MTDSDADREAALLAEIELRWAEADRARSRVIRPARRTTTTVTGPLGTFVVHITRHGKPF